MVKQRGPQPVVLLATRRRLRQLGLLRPGGGAALLDPEERAQQPHVGEEGADGRLQARAL